MSLIIPITIILLLSFSISSLFKFKPNESLFLSICSIILLNYIFAYLNMLAFIAWLIGAVTLIGFVYLTFSMIKRRRLTKNIIAFISAPGLLAYIVVIFIYCFFAKNAYLHRWDDFSLWAYNARALQLYNGFKAAPLLGPQAIGITLFNVFTINLSGFSDGHLICSQQIALWACALLPLSFEKSYKKTALYTILLYCIMFSTSFYMLDLYNDITLSLFGAALIGYYYVSPNKNHTPTYIVLLFGLLVLPHVKLIMGLIFALFVLIILIYDHQKKAMHPLSKRTLITYIVAILIPFASYLLHIIFQHLFHASSFSSLSSKQWCDPIGSILTAVKSLPGLSLVALILGAFIFFIIALFKQKKPNLFFYIFMSFSLILAGYAFLFLDGPTLELIKNYVPNLLFIPYQGIPFYQVVGLFAIVSAWFYYVIIQPRHKKTFLSLTFIILIELFLYTLALLASYTQFLEFEAMQSAEIFRYIQTFINFVLILFVVLVLLKNHIFSNTTHRIAMTIMIATAIIFTMLPPLFSLVGYQRGYNYAESYPAKINQDMAPLEAPLTSNDAVYLISQGDNRFVRFQAAYQLLPARVNTDGFSLVGEPDDDLFSDQISASELNQRLIDGEYTYLYLFIIDDYFIKTFGAMFENPSAISDHTIYEINTNSTGQVSFSIIE